MKGFRFVCRGLLAGLAMATTLAYANEIKISGFANITAGTSNDEDVPYGMYDENISFKPDSLIGLQFQKDLDDNLSFTTQMTSRGMNNYDSRIEWAYLSYHVNNHWTVKAGKFRTPFYEYSETLDVGYTYHWVKPPEAVYIPLFNNMEGANVTYKSRFGRLDSRLNLFYGTLQEESPAGPVELPYMAGGSLNLGYQSFGARLSYFKSKTTIPPVFAPDVLALLPSDAAPPGAPPAPGGPGPDAPTLSQDVADAIIPEEEDSTYFGLALKAELGDLLALYEYTTTEMDDSIFTDPVGQYISLAYTLGDWQPHITFEDFDTSPRTEILDLMAADDPLRPQLAAIIDSTNEDYSRITVGVRYDFHYTTALKIDYSQVDYDEELQSPVRPRLDGELISVSISTLF
ncbi:hypothetical protein CHH28_05735 [Bacterioplanes sanyensis]|uniref:Porin domain-containing protein n=1 Tax=Bacterioplanes sanyensis TaxID=1249553 RepID=A0A222FGN1_9GAMM|nr:hypothetical protein [Bacterioplanes sanyensis]ASP38215.1 hypothetical protein CHH28_05735 [Bacterioplanes sanyensis]